MLRRLNEEKEITVLVNLHQLELVEKYFDKVIGLKAGALHFASPVGSAETAQALKSIYS